MPVATVSVALAQLKVTVTGRSSKDEPTLHRNVGYLVTTARLVARALYNDIFAVALWQNTGPFWLLKCCKRLPTVLAVLIVPHCSR